jgi:uncharacterized protein (DUF305 family)
MAENSQLSESQNPPPVSSASASKSPVSKKQQAKKSTHVKSAVHMLVDHDHALRLASILLQRDNDPIYEMQQMVDEALARYIDYLHNKKNINFLGIITHKITSSR